MCSLFIESTFLVPPKLLSYSPYPLMVDDIAVATFKAFKNSFQSGPSFGRNSSHVSLNVTFNQRVIVTYRFSVFNAQESNSWKPIWKK